MTVSAAVLRNKGVAIKLAQVGDDGEVVRDAQGKVQEEDVWIRLTTNELVDIEDAFGSTDEGLTKALEERPQGTLRTLLSITLGMDTRAVGIRMLPEKKEDYLTAVTGALALAQGVDPTQVAKMIEAGSKAAKQARAEENAAAGKYVDEVIAGLEKAAKKGTVDSRGSNGSEPGPGPVAASTSSGG